MLDPDYLRHAVQSDQSIIYINKDTDEFVGFVFMSFTSSVIVLGWLSDGFIASSR